MIAYELQPLQKKQEQLNMSKHKNGPKLAYDKNRINSEADDFNIFDTENEMPSP